MNIKARKANKLKELEISKISYMIDCLKEKVKAQEPITEEDKAEILSDIEQGLTTIMSYNKYLNAEPEELENFQ